MAVLGSWPFIGCGGVFSTSEVLDGKFIGTGAGPAVIRPRDGERIYNQDYFSWEPAVDAGSSRIQIAEDDSFLSMVVDEEIRGSFWQLPAGENSPVQWLGRTYYWRVFSGGMYSDVSSFNFMEDETIYISSTADPEMPIGNRAFPFTDYQAAEEYIFARYGVAEGLTIRISGGRYAPLLLAGSLNIEGGYNPQNWENNPDENPTIIEQTGSEGALGVFDGGVVTVENLVLENSGDYPGLYFGVAGVSAGVLTIRNSSITNSGAGTGCYGAIASDDGVLSIQDSTVTLETTCDELTSGGVVVGNGQATWSNTVFSVKDNGTLFGTAGLVASQGGRITAENCDIRVEGNSGFGIAAGFLAGIDGGKTEISNNRIAVSASAVTSIGILIKSPDATITNNALYFKVDNASAVHVDSGFGRIEQNTIYADGSGNTLVRVSGTTEVSSNILFTDGSGQGVFETTLAAEVDVFTENLLFDVTTFYDDKDGGGIITAVGDLNNHTLTTQNGAASSTGNLTAAGQSSVFGNNVAEDFLNWPIAGGGPADLDSSGGWSSGDIGADIVSTGVTQ